MPQPDIEIVRSLRQAGLIDDPATCRFAPLAGGVSSDIWKIATPAATFCVKRALAKLKVAADWHAPVERNRFEVAWYRFAGDTVPGAAPRILFHDPASKLFAMGFLDPRDYPLWKGELRDGRARIEHAQQVGERLGRIHAASAGSRDVDAAFPANTIFHAIRLEPYLEATAAAHPDLHAPLFDLSRRTGTQRKVMVHGDVSPKNILIGSAGPVFLDAECACIGDPAFDLAFCLNHLLLKSLWAPSFRPAFNACFDALATAYLAEVKWEPREEVEARTASLLPALLLARIDGKSPVEYVTNDDDRNRVRHCARPIIARPVARLADVLDAWNRELDT